MCLLCRPSQTYKQTDAWTESQTTQADGYMPLPPTGVQMHKNTRHKTVHRHTQQKYNVTHVKGEREEARDIVLITKQRDHSSLKSRAKLHSREQPAQTQLQTHNSASLLSTCTCCSLYFWLCQKTVLKCDWLVQISCPHQRSSDNTTERQNHRQTGHTPNNIMALAAT